MKILVLGGSYFLGKHFVNMAKDTHDVTVFNRGTRPLGLLGVKEVVGDRHDMDALKSLHVKHYDAVVDFCAYERDDIASVFSQLSGDFEQYIYISTCDVYEHGLGRKLDEKSPFERRSLDGEAGRYIVGKVALEEELLECASRYDVAYTSMRPAIIYGPDNYAPRESIYFYWIDNAGQVLHPVDATGEFQMVYVEDVAKAIMNSLENGQAHNQTYNLTPSPMVTYESFVEALTQSLDVSFEKIPVTLETVYEKKIPLPFPLTKEESNWYNGDKALKLIGNYTPLVEGLKKARN